MGVVQRQAAKASFFNLIGIALGILNVLFVVPIALEAYGVYAFVSNVVGMLMPIITLGMSSGGVRFFNEYNDGSRSNRTFLTMGFGAIIIGFIALCVIVFLFKRPIIDYYQSREPINYKYLIFVLPLTFALAVISFLINYISNFKRIAIPALFKNLIKIMLPILLLLYVSEMLTLGGVLMGVTIFHFFLIALLLWYLRSLGELDFRWESKVFANGQSKAMRYFMLNGIFLSLGSVLASFIDGVMVGSMINIGKATAVYSIGTVISTIMIMPNSVIASITSPIIAALWKENNVKEIQVVYQKAGLNLIILGVLLFVGVWINIDDVFLLMANSDEISKAKYVIFFLGIARLWSMACGINGLILNLSSEYRYSTYFILVLAGLNILTNYIFIGWYGITGAAIGTAISILLYNGLIVGFNALKFGLNPFSWGGLKTVVIGIVIYLCFFKLDLFHPFIDIILRSLLVTLTYGLTIYWLKFSIDFNMMVNKYARMIGLGSFFNR